MSALQFKHSMPDLNLKEGQSITEETTDSTQVLLLPPAGQCANRIREREASQCMSPANTGFRASTPPAWRGLHICRPVLRKLARSPHTSTARSMRAFVEPPEFRFSVIQWIVSSCYGVVSMFRLQLVVDPSSYILRFKVGVYRAPEPVARSNFYPCRHWAGHHIPHARKAPGPNPGYQRAP